MKPCRSCDKSGGVLTTVTENPNPDSYVMMVKRRNGANEWEDRETFIRDNEDGTFSYYVNCGDCNGVGYLTEEFGSHAPQTVEEIKRFNESRGKA